MKTTFQLLLCALFVSPVISLSYAGNSSGPESGLSLQEGTKQNSKCGTVEFNKRVLERYPQYKAEIESIEKFTKGYEKTDNLIITIPLVVHVIYNLPEQNISDAQIQSQIDVLNRDFARLNADTVNTPAPFKPLGANVQIQFCLAQRTPNNEFTNGITRTMTNIVSYTVDDTSMYYASLGGVDIWDRNRYFNCYVVNFTGTILGFAQLPGGPPNTDGMVIGHKYFGTIGTVVPPNDKGRTATHEVGHWFNLQHIWGDEPGCAQDDEVDDTPLQAGENGGCPAFPLLDACTTVAPGVMFTNYMDYVDDNCMNIFTIGQSTRMNAALSGPRASLITSNGCTSVGINNISSEVPESFLLQQNYPNPFNPNTNIVFSIPKSSFVTLKIFDIAGKEIATIVNQNLPSGTFKADWNASGFSSGLYLYTIETDGFRQTRKMMLTK
ncbi:MAG: T9SS type A sorting domain-containing protein [Ignavibacteria bacterium]|nr:T9SS type A sorting domain-containing protein [Ignavibacteria bacterium]